VNREAKARALAGLKGYTTNLAACPAGTPVTAEFVISSYHQRRRLISNLITKLNIMLIGSIRSRPTPSSRSDILGRMALSPPTL